MQATLARSRAWKSLVRSRWLYLLLAPGLVYFLCFRYLPMGGIVVAFKDYNIFAGIRESPWVGFEHFRTLFHSLRFWRVFRNTLIISAYKVLFLFPLPIVLALLLNEMRSKGVKRTVQTVIYLPHFISWVVIGGVILSITSIQYGVAREVFRLLGVKPFNIMASARHFRAILVVSEGWKESGWGTIVYLAALSQVDPNLYEAAVVDGAGRLRQAWHISLPTLAGVVGMLLILRVGNIMEAGSEQILALQNFLVLDVSDVFDTYILRTGIGEGQYSFTTAVGLFKSVIALVLVATANKVSRSLTGEGLL